ncbi:tubulin-tyrosine ligase family-domain-containing protein [Haematococcus lacustris]
MPLGHGPGSRARTGQAELGRPPSPPAPLPAATTPTAKAMPPSQPCSPGRPAQPASLAAQQQQAEQAEACPAPTDPPAARATMTVMEAALAAFQQEQRLLHRARKQLHKVPPARQAAATQASRAEVAAAYRRLPPPPQQPGAAYAVGARQQGPPRPAPLQPPSPSAVPPGGPEARQRDGSTSPSPVSVEEEGQQEGWVSERLQGARQGLQPAGPAVGSPPAPLSSDSDSIPVEPQAKQTASSNGVGSFPSCSSAPGSVSEEGSSSSSTAAPPTAQPHPPCSPEVAQPFPAASSQQPALPATAPSPTLHALSSSSSSASSEGYETDSGPDSPRPHPGGTPCRGAARSSSSSSRREAAIPGPVLPAGAAALLACRAGGSGCGTDSDARPPPAALAVDRWHDWDWGTDQGVSAWGRGVEDDPLAAALAHMAEAPRAPSHAPPLALLNPTPAAAAPLPLPPLKPAPKSSLRAAPTAAQLSSMAHIAAEQQQQQTAAAASVQGGAPGCPAGSKPGAAAARPSATCTAQLPSAAGPATDPVPTSRDQQDLGTHLHPCQPAPPASGPGPPALPTSSQPAAAAATAPCRAPGQAGPPPRPPRTLSPCHSLAAAAAAELPGAVYAAHYTSFHEVLSCCAHAWGLWTAAGQEGGAGRPASSSRVTADASAQSIAEKYHGLLLRLAAWRQATGSQMAPLAMEPPQHQQLALQAAAAPTPTRPMPLRYYAVADDSAHPEVRQVLELALGPLPGWRPDPLDQVTEQARPDTWEDDTGLCLAEAGQRNLGAGSAAGGSAAAAAGDGDAGRQASVPGAGAAPYHQQRSPLAGRCNVWNLLWSWSVKARPPLSELLVWQRVNHFPEARQLTRKDLLKKHLVRYQMMHGGHARLGPLFSCLPTTWVLPKEHSAAADALLRACMGVEPSVTQPAGLNLWIAKPVCLSRGRGIRLVRSLRELEAGAGGSGSSDNPLVLQRYVTNPLTVQGYKFDLRLYVLVTRFNPLEAWLCSEGLARFATLPFNLDEANFSNRFIHLTNSSVQRSRAEGGQVPHFLASAQPSGGSKLSFAQLRPLLVAQGVDWTQLWARITDVVTTCLFVAQDAIPACVNAFELFGFDVLVDTAGTVWLLEVNSSPSLSLGTPLDRTLKPKMVRDAIAIVDPLSFDRDALAEVLSRRTSTRGSRNGRRPTAGSALQAGTASEERHVTWSDLQQVLHGQVPRKYGEALHQVGPEPNWFTCIAPSPLLDKLTKLRKPIG